jgi:hypothetical protein
MAMIFKVGKWVINLNNVIAIDTDYIGIEYTNITASTKHGVILYFAVPSVTVNNPVAEGLKHPRESKADRVWRDQGRFDGVGNRLCFPALNQGVHRGVGEIRLRHGTEIGQTVRGDRTRHLDRHKIIRKQLELSGGDRTAEHNPQEGGFYRDCIRHTGCRFPIAKRWCQQWRAAMTCGDYSVGEDLVSRAIVTRR